MNQQLPLFPVDLTKPILDVLYNPRNIKRRKQFASTNAGHNRSGCPSHYNSTQTGLWG